jgi:hypothetical protein
MGSRGYAHSTLGGVIFPILVERVIKDVGFASAMRYAAHFIGALTITCILVKPRLPQKKWDSNLKLFNFQLLIDKSFGIYIIGAFLVM